MPRSVNIEYAAHRPIRNRNKPFYRLAHWPIWIWVFFLSAGPVVFRLFAYGPNARTLAWLSAVILATGLAGLRGQLPGVEPAPYILRFTEDKPNPLYRRICYTFAWNVVVNFVVLNWIGLAVAAVTQRWYLRQIYSAGYFPLAILIWTLGLFGLLPRVETVHCRRGPRTPLLLRLGVGRVRRPASALDTLDRSADDPVRQHRQIADLHRRSRLHGRVGRPRSPPAHPSHSPGRADGRRLMSAEGAALLHNVDLGSGSPALVLESGIAASSLSWRPLQQRIACFTRVLSYDRAGLGWSAPAEPRSLTQLVAELHSLIQHRAVPVPIILVGHSFGGLVVRAYTAAHPELVAGLILLDPVLPADWCAVSPGRRRLLARGVALSRRGALLARLGVVRLAITLAERGARLIPRLINRVSSGEGSGVPERLIGEVRKLPPELWPLIKAQWCQPKSFHAMASYLALLPEACEETDQLPPTEIPLTIISAANATPAQLAEWDRLAPAHHIRAKSAGHWIHLDEPELVLTAIREMIERVSGL